MSGWCCTRHLIILSLRDFIERFVSLSIEGLILIGSVELFSKILLVRLFSLLYSNPMRFAAHQIDSTTEIKSEP